MQYSKLGDYIRKKRLIQYPEVSLNTFAFDAGIEPAVLSRIERGLQDIKLEVLAKIAKRFGLSGSELLLEFENFRAQNGD